jgi:hypothetical protein
MRTLVNFIRRDGWFIHCLAADCRTLISRRVMVCSDQTLLRLFKASGATPPEVDKIEGDIRRWGRGSTFIEVNLPTPGAKSTPADTHMGCTNANACWPSLIERGSRCQTAMG